MSIHKRRSTGKNGKAKNSKKWYIYLRDHNGQVHDNIPAFTDKAASLELDRHLQRLVALRVAGSGPDAELARFLEGCPQSLVEKLAEWGIVSAERAAAGKTLTEHIEEWKLAMEAKGDVPRHITGFSGNLRHIINDRGWHHLSDISLTDLNLWIAEQRRTNVRAAATINHHIRAAKAFTNWLAKEKRIPENLLRYAQLLNAKTDRRIVRRPSSIDDLSRLLAATEKGEKHHKLIGPERALLYRLALETGLRWSELRSLKRSSFDFDSVPATVHVQARYAKNRKDDWLPLRTELAIDLQGIWHCFYRRLEYLIWVQLEVPKCYA